MMCKLRILFFFPDVEGQWHKSLHNEQCIGCKGLPQRPHTCCGRLAAPVLQEQVGNGGLR